MILGKPEAIEHVLVALLAADILGSSVYSPRDGSFTFKEGPVFANVLLADEINRASPRTQSALLEAMSEGQVSSEGVTRVLPTPFLVLATQNPVEFHGTYPLPEAQLDRFGLRIGLGYPAAEQEADVLFSQAERHPLESVVPVLSAPDVRSCARSSAGGPPSAARVPRAGACSSTRGPSPRPPDREHRCRPRSSRPEGRSSEPTTARASAARPPIGLKRPGFATLCAAEWPARSARGAFSRTGAHPGP